MMAELFDEERMREEDNEAVRAEGRAEGKAEGKLETLLELVRKGFLTLAQAAAEAHMTEEEFNTKISNLTV